MNHTPGPWEHMTGYGSCNDSETIVEHVFGANRTLVAECIIETDLQSIPEEAKANARLIAEAPTMFAAMVAVIRDPAFKHLDPDLQMACITAEMHVRGELDQSVRRDVPLLAADEEN